MYPLPFVPTHCSMVLKSVLLSDSSPEFRADKRAMLLRLNEEARKPRFLDAVQRTKGIDAVTLAEQVKESQARKETENRERLDEELRLLEISSQQQKEELARLAEKRLQKKNYGAELLEMMKSKEVSSVGKDATCFEAGPSSLLRFEGEDLEKANRLKIQRAQQADWIAQGIFEKKILQPLKNSPQTLPYRDNLDETNRRRELAIKFRAENQRMAEEKLQAQKIAPSHSDSNFLKHSRDFRGAGKEAVKACAKDCEILAAQKEKEKKQHEYENKATDQKWEAARFSNLLNDDAKMVKRRNDAVNVRIIYLKKYILERTRKSSPCRYSERTTKNCKI